MIKINYLIFVSFIFFTGKVMANCTELLDKNVNDINGNPTNLCEYKDKVILAVNTASRCGYTPQYKELQKLYESFKDKGFIIVAFPSNDFGGQEPGSNSEIKTLCEKNYGVKFPIMEKSSVTSNSANPFFKELTKITGEAPRWNFHKYLISKNAQEVVSYRSGVSPKNDNFLSKLEEFLSGS